ncbi:MAG: hypothetical protein U0264_06605 [Candidatus Kapaibacterium sp.]
MQCKCNLPSQHNGTFAAIHYASPELTSPCDSIAPTIAYLFCGAPRYRGE